MDKFLNMIIQGEALTILKTIPDETIDSVITSPPYWSLRIYGDDSAEIGKEKTFQEYIAKLVEIFDEVKRVLKPTGTCFVNIADTYAGTMPKNKDDVGKNSKIAKNLINAGINGKGTKGQSIQDKSLCLIPYRFAVAMTDRGWIARNVIIWHKRNAMPSSVKDRFTVDYEPILFFTKNKKYYFEQQFEPYTVPMNRWGGDKLKASGESKWDDGTGQDTYRDRNMRPNKSGKNMRSVWDIPTKPSSLPHFAMYPEALVERMIRAGCPEGGIVLDPFAGAGNTLIAAQKMNRSFIGIELYSKYVAIVQKRLTTQ